MKNVKKKIIKITLGFMALSFILLGCNQLKKKDNGTNNFLVALLGLSSNPDTWFFVSNSGGANLSAYTHSSAGVNTLAKTIALPATSSGEMHGTHTGHIFVAMKNENSVGVLDMSSGSPEFIQSLQAGTRPNHMYLSPNGETLWVMNDGNAAAPDKGADMINCDTNSASVTVIQDGAEGKTGAQNARVLKTICVGRGHHKAAFSTTPLRAFVSNITDGTITVIDADPASQSYLNVIKTISLCDQAKETALAKGITCPLTDPAPGVINSSAPHGIAYSPISGKIYNSSTGYGTVAVIDATTFAMSSVQVGYTGTLHMSVNNDYVVLKGVDSNTDLNHVIGKMNVIRVSDNTVNTVDLMDVSPDHFMFTPDGSRLYVVSATKGAGAQLTNLKNDVVLVYDSSNLPQLTFMQEIKVGVATASHRSLDIISHDGIPMNIIVPNDGDQNVSVIDYATNTVKETLSFDGIPNSVYVNSHSSHGH